MHKSLQFATSACSMDSTFWQKTITGVMHNSQRIIRKVEDVKVRLSYKYHEHVTNLAFVWRSINTRGKLKEVAPNATSYHITITMYT